MFDKCQQGPFDSDAYMTYASCPRLADHVRVCANLSWVYRAECWVRRLHSTMLATPSTYCFCLSLCFALGRGGQAVPTPRSFELPHPVILSLFLSPGLWCRGLTPYTSLSLSLSLYPAWGRQQRPDCLPRADTHTRVPWQVVSSARAFRTEGLGCTDKTEGEGKGMLPPTTSSGVPKTFSWAGLKTNLSLPLQIQIWGALSRNKDYGPGWAQV